MKKVLFLLLGLISVAAYAQDFSETIEPISGTLNVKSAFDGECGDENSKNFEVDILRSGNYYAAFWLLPALHSDGNYTTYHVYVNGYSVGDVTPTTGNWQSVEFPGTLSLQSGRNTISISTVSPEFPNVELMNVSRNQSEVAFSSTAYNTYLQDARNGVVTEEADNVTMQSVAAPNSSSTMLVFNNVPLRYSYNGIYRFAYGDNVSICTSSSIAHKVDVVYLGKSSFGGDIDPINGTASPLSIPLDKQFIPLRSVTPTERMENSSVNNSIRYFVSGLNKINTSVNITKAGYYIIKLRSAMHNTLGTATITVNSEYTNEDVPIYYYGLLCDNPADGNVYTALTLCNDAANDDPVLLAENTQERLIIGYSDDVLSASIRDSYHMSRRDAYLSQVYPADSDVLHVYSYGSYNPNSTCSLWAQIMLDDTDANVSEYMAKAMKSEDATGISSVPTGLSRVKIYKANGELVYDKNISISEIPNNLRGWNITDKGIYILSIENGRAVSTKQFVVK